MEKFKTLKFWPVLAQIKPLNMDQANMNLLRHAVPTADVIPMKRDISTGIVLTRRENVMMVGENAKGEVKAYAIGWE